MLMDVSALPILSAAVNSVPIGITVNGFAAGADKQLLANINSATKRVEFYAYDPVTGLTSQPSVDTSVSVLRVAGTCRAF